jgi:hypothetical protein
MHCPKEEGRRRSASLQTVAGCGDYIIAKLKEDLKSETVTKD